jgi:hypothetical protein
MSIEEADAIHWSNAESEGGSAMSAQQRADVLAAISTLCQRYPDWRFGQLVANVAG